MPYVIPLGRCCRTFSVAYMSKLSYLRASNRERKCADTIGTVPVPWVAISNAKILIYFSNKICGSNFIKQHSETIVMVWNYQNADCIFKKKIVSFIIIFGTLSFPINNSLASDATWVGYFLKSICLSWKYKHKNGVLKILFEMLFGRYFCTDLYLKCHEHRRNFVCDDGDLLPPLL